VLHQHQRRVGLAEPRQVLERGELGERRPVRDRHHAAERHHHARVDPRQQRLAPCGILGGRDLRGQQGGEGQRGHGGGRREDLSE
jgi:hypothetical protein